MGVIVPSTVSIYICTENSNLPPVDQFQDAEAELVLSLLKVPSSLLPSLLSLDRSLPPIRTKTSVFVYSDSELRSFPPYTKTPIFVRTYDRSLLAPPRYLYTRSYSTVTVDTSPDDRVVAELSPD